MLFLCSWVLISSETLVRESGDRTIDSVSEFLDAVLAGWIMMLVDLEAVVCASGSALAVSLEAGVELMLSTVLRETGEGEEVGFTMTPGEDDPILLWPLLVATCFSKEVDKLLAINLELEGDSFFLLFAVRMPDLEGPLQALVLISFSFFWPECF